MHKEFKIENRIRLLTEKYSPFTNVVGLSRSLLALGLLLTLLSTDINTLVHKYNDGNLVNPLLNESVALNKYNFFILFGYDHLNLMKYLAIIILAIVISGFWFKITSFLHWWIAISFLYFSSIIDGGDQINAVISLMLIPVLLFDKRKNHWEKMNNEISVRGIIPIITIWIIRLQVALIYFQASVGKYFVPEWADGTAIYYWWNHTVFGMPIIISNSINFALSNSFVVSFITYSVLILEILIFLGLTANLKYRKIILFIGIFFHFSIIIFHGIFSFFFSITACLILFLYPTYQNINFKKYLL
ncbi:HTTM domain-containing protein [Candidatus Ornithobacterium hominis]|uniref:sporulation-delaying protein SdpB family protein n=1 Tax=Candidatus Ornithobacterium hominis TaxID=2497989 RepID=UPI0024BD1210|nr:sporulation-delaying protein SdpB family protein [Candidatus Ornithobacterium hominis]CAI9429391.1 HTTM domain-containing protein [Candidatus Ornithobacterium hominis]